MSYVDEPFPFNVSKTSRGGPRMSLAVTESPDSGAQERSKRWASYRWEYDAGVGIQKDTLLDEVYKHSICVGQENSFPFIDPKDFTSQADGRADPTQSGTLDQIIGVGDGVTTLFQLSKTYVFGQRNYLRNIRKPLSNRTYKAIDGTTKTANVFVSVNNVLQTVGTNYSLDTSTGQILFVSAPGNGLTVRASYVFYVPVFYGEGFSFQRSYEAIDAGRVASVPLVEDTGQSAITPDFPYLGGGDTITVSSNLLFDYNWGRSVFFLPTADGFAITLPNLADVPFGGRILTLANIAASGPKTITFKNRSTGATEFSLAIGTSADLYARKDTGGTKVWTAI